VISISTSVQSTYVQCTVFAVGAFHVVRYFLCYSFLCVYSRRQRHFVCLYVIVLSLSLFLSLCVFCFVYLDCHSSGWMWRWVESRAYFRFLSIWQFPQRCLGYCRFRSFSWGKDSTRIRTSHQDRKQNKTKQNKTKQNKKDGSPKKRTKQTNTLDPHTQLHKVVT
jgi:hypothetical protein